VNLGNYENIKIMTNEYPDIIACLHELRASLRLLGEPARKFIENYIDPVLDPPTAIRVVKPERLADPYCKVRKFCKDRPDKCDECLYNDPNVVHPAHYFTPAPWGKIDLKGDKGDEEGEK